MSRMVCVEWMPAALNAEETEGRRHGGCEYPGEAGFSPLRVSAPPFPPREAKANPSRNDKTALARRAGRTAFHCLGERPRGRYSALGRTLPSLMRFSMTVFAIEAGTGSYCLKIIVNVPRPCVTVRIAFE